MLTEGNIQYVVENHSDAIDVFPEFLFLINSAQRGGEQALLLSRCV
jgi:hypothetical protein